PAQTEARQLQPRAFISGPTVVAFAEHARRRVYLPSVRCACHAARFVETSTQMGKRRVLVADDNASLRRALQIVLELWGFEVTIAEDGSAALAAARQGQHQA